MLCLMPDDIKLVGEDLIHATLIAIIVSASIVYFYRVTCHVMNVTSNSRQCGSGSYAYRVLTESMAKRVRNRHRWRQSHVSSRRVKVEPEGAS